MRRRGHNYAKWDLTPTYDDWGNFMGTAKEALSHPNAFRGISAGEEFHPSAFEPDRHSYRKWGKYVAATGFALLSTGLGLAVRQDQNAKHKDVVTEGTQKSQPLDEHLTQTAWKLPPGSKLPAADGEIS